jgi:hypothetical protein
VVDVLLFMPTYRVGMVEGTFDSLTIKANVN